MTETVLQALVTYGAALMFVTAFLSCLMVPIPMSLVMITGGALSAQGDLAFTVVWVATLFGAVLGDQTGYAIGRRGRDHVDGFAMTTHKRRILWMKAQNHLRDWGTLGVFLSRWLFSPLGPYVNFVAGAGSIPWSRFTSAGIAGELIWVTGYVGLGYVFAENLPLAVSYAEESLRSVGAFFIMFTCTYVILNFARRRRSVLS